MKGGAPSPSSRGKDCLLSLMLGPPWGLRPTTSTTAKQFRRWLGGLELCCSMGGSVSESGLLGGADLKVQIPSEVRTIAGALC